MLKQLQVLDVKNGRKRKNDIRYNNINWFMELMKMSIEKQKLYNEIEKLPEELTNQVINFIEYLKFSHVDREALDSVTIKSKKDLKEKLQWN